MPRKPPPAKRPQHSRLQTYIPGHVHDEVALYCARRGWHESTFFETASLQLLDGTGDKALLFRQIESTKRSIRRLDQKIDAVLEMVNRFVQIWMQRNPPLPDGDVKSGSGRQAAADHQRFVQDLLRALGSGPAFFDEFLNEEPVDDAGETPLRANPSSPSNYPNRA